VCGRQGFVRDLHEQPCDHCVCDRNLVNVAQLEFGEEVPKLTSCYLLGPICSGPESSCWKSGRLRMGSQTGSIFKRAMEDTVPAGMESKRRSLLMASSGAPARTSICASPFWKFGPARASFSMEIVSAACLERRSASALRPKARKTQDTSSIAKVSSGRSLNLASSN